MPFKSQKQLRTCYGTRPRGWDCDEWLQETKYAAECLPEENGGKYKCRKIKKGEHIIGKLQRGPRGGYFFMVDKVKIYVPKKAGKYLSKK